MVFQGKGLTVAVALFGLFSTAEAMFHNHTGGHGHDFVKLENIKDISIGGFILLLVVVGAYFDNKNNQQIIAGQGPAAPLLARRVPAG